VLVGGHFSKEILPAIKGLQVEEFIFNGGMDGFDICIGIRTAWRRGSVLRPE
jgi:hypothetical protein